MALVCKVLLGGDNPGGDWGCRQCLFTLPFMVAGSVHLRGHNGCSSMHSLTMASQEAPRCLRACPGADNDVPMVDCHNAMHISILNIVVQSWLLIFVIARKASNNRRGKKPF